MIITQIDDKGLNESLIFHIDKDINEADSQIKMAKTLQDFQTAILLEQKNLQWLKSKNEWLNKELFGMKEELGLLLKKNEELVKELHFIKDAAEEQLQEVRTNLEEKVKQIEDSKA